MKHKILPFLTFLLIIIQSSGVFAQSTSYNPHKAFDPLFDSQSATIYRSSDGQPGPEYWSNRTNYKIYATLDTVHKSISGDETITYINNSPDQLSYLWIQLDQNRFAKDSRSAATSDQLFNPKKFDGGYHIQSVSIESDGKFIPANYLINDTRMQVRLTKPLASKGGTIKIRIKYNFTIAPKGNGRSGWIATKNGPIFDVAQWFPRMCVYDDLMGWNVIPFLGAGEFYLDYGNYDVSINLPWDQIIVSSGSLENPDKVLTKKTIRRLDEAKKSDKTVAIRTEKDINNPKSRPVQEGRLVWHFKMNNSRDFTWASSKAFLWDAARVNLPHHKTALAMAVYPVESAGDTAWSRAVEYLKGSIELFSKHWYPYPYPTATTVGGPVGGMEYPGIVFCWWKATGKSLWMVTNHEIGHNWFPMIVGSNERKDTWMDEGFNTFIDIYATKNFNKGEFAPKRDHEFDPKGINPARDIVPLLLNSKVPPIISYSDGIPYKYVHPLEYYKTALGLVLLRQYILGPKRFDYAFRTYVRSWAYKHPSPLDFFRCMNNASGENLNWFWKGWFIKKWTLDQAVTGVKYVDNNPAKGALITLENKNQMVMPVTLEITESNGDSSRVKLPVEIWERSGTFTLHFNSTAPLKKVTLDPDKVLPDVNAANNIWTSTSIKQSEYKHFKRNQ